MLNVRKLGGGGHVKLYITSEIRTLVFLSQVSSVLITSVDSFDSRSEEVVPNISREKKHSVSKETYANLSTVGTSLFQEQIEMSHWPPGTLSVLPKSVPPKSVPPKECASKECASKECV